MIAPATVRLRKGRDEIDIEVVSLHAVITPSADWV